MLVVGTGCPAAGPESAVAATLSPVGACAPSAGTDLVLRPIAEGLRKPVLLITPPGEDRLFVLEQPGRSQPGSVLAGGHLVAVSGSRHSVGLNFVH